MTRQLILDAAQRLFERDGYAATSMASIAGAAGVSLKTAYLAFDTKSGVLREVWHRVLRGEVGRVPVDRQGWYREVLDEPDPVRQLQLNARNSRVVKERAGAIMEVIRAAAPGNPEIGALWARIQAEFRANQRTVVESLDAKDALAPRLGVEQAADVLWTLNHPSVYGLLVGERRWTPGQYEGWLVGILCRELLSEEARTPAPRR
jgi:AcrR family transcriptional regulator